MNQKLQLQPAVYFICVLKPIPRDNVHFFQRCITFSMIHFKIYSIWHTMEALVHCGICFWKKCHCNVATAWWVKDMEVVIYKLLYARAVVFYYFYYQTDTFCKQLIMSVRYSKQSNNYLVCINRSNISFLIIFIISYHSRLYSFYTSIFYNKISRNDQLLNRLKIRLVF